MNLIDILKQYEAELHVVDEEVEKSRSVRMGSGCFINGLLGFIIIPTIAPFLALFFSDSTYFAAYLLFCMFILPIIAFILLTIRSKHKTKKANAQIANSNEIIYQQHEKINSLGVIPNSYHDTYSIRAFIHYIESLQAKTLEECIALKREDDMHREQMNAIYSANAELEYEMNRANRELRSIKRKLK